MKTGEKKRRVRAQARAHRAMIAMAGLLTGTNVAQAQVFWYPPHFQTGPVTSGDNLVGIPLPQATPGELDANLLWNLRSGLNVAALKCQQWPGLLIVDNYNDTLIHHKKELAKTYSTLNAYFKRTNKNGARQFDDYSTRTYNTFSMSNAQKSFCHVAGKISREVLAAPKGKMIEVARNNLRELRNSLNGYIDPFIAGTDTNRLVRALPRLDKKCWKGDRYNERKCRLNA